MAGVEINYETYEIIVTVDYQEKGDSAYKIAVDEGFVGTKVEWLQSLKQPAIDAGVYATEQGDYAKQVGKDTELVRLATEQVRQDTLSAKSLTEQATDNANSAASYAGGIGDAVQQIGLDTIAVKEATDQVRIDTLAAKQATETATGNANTATTNANNAATSANEAAANTDIATEAANTATDLANTATTNANTAADNANTAAFNIRTYINFMFDVEQTETGNVLVYAMDNNFKKSSQKFVLRLDYLIKQLKQYNLFGREEFEYYMAGDGDMDFKTINIINPALYKATLFGGLINKLTGIELNGLNTYIKTNHSYSTDPARKYKLNDAGRNAFIREVTKPNYFDGTEGAGNWNRTFMGTTFHRINSPDIVSPATLNGDGYRSINRVSDLQVIFVKDGLEIPIESISSESNLFGNSLIGRANTQYAGFTISNYSIGGALVGIDAINKRRCILNSLVELDETRRVINRAADEGFELPDQNTLFAIDLAIWKLKNTIITNKSLWDKEDLWLRFGYNNLALSEFARINLKSPTSNLATLIANPIYTLNGYEGDGIGATIRTGFNPTIGINNYGLNNARRGVTIYKQPTGVEGGIESYGGTGSLGNYLYNISTTSHRINSGANNLSTAADLTGDGYKSINRYDSINVSLFNKAVENKRTQVSTALASIDQELFVTKRSTTNGYSDLGMMDYDMGASFNAAETLAYRNIMNELSVTLGLTPYA